MTGSPQERLAATAHGTDADALVDALDALARSIRDDDGYGQRELFQLFDRARQTHADDADYTVYDALGEVLDRITGWCLDRYKLFP